MRKEHLFSLEELDFLQKRGIGTDGLKWPFQGPGVKAFLSNWNAADVEAESQVCLCSMCQVRDLTEALTPEPGPADGS